MNSDLMEPHENHLFIPEGNRMFLLLREPEPGES